MDQPTGPRPTDGPRGSLALAVVDAVADREGVDAVDLDPPLSDVVDPDGLERLFRVDAAGNRRVRGHVTFPYGAYRVTVTSDGEVEVTSSPADDPSAPGASGPRTNSRSDGIR